MGQKYGIHICLNIHGAPGYCVNEKTKEGYNLWKDKEPLELFVLYWQTFAKRYKGISSKYLSFNLINEPRQYSKEEMTKEDFIRVMTYTVEKIREIDKERLIIIDGVDYGNEPVFELASLGKWRKLAGHTFRLNLHTIGQNGCKEVTSLVCLRGHLYAKMVKLLIKII